MWQFDKPEDQRIIISFQRNFAESTRNRCTNSTPYRTHAHTRTPTHAHAEHHVERRTHPLRRGRPLPLRGRREPVRGPSHQGAGNVSRRSRRSPLSVDREHSSGYHKQRVRPFLLYRPRQLVPSCRKHCAFLMF